MKRSMLNVYNDPYLRHRMAATVHDELVAGPFEEPGKAAFAAERLHAAMTKGFSSTLLEGIPIPIDVKVQKKWQH